MNSYSDVTTSSEDTGGGIQEIIALIIKRLPHIIAIVTLGMTLVVINLIMTPHTYESTASILVSPKEERVTKQENIIQDALTLTIADTAVAELTSPNTLVRAAKNHFLNEKPSPSIISRFIGTIQAFIVHSFGSKGFATTSSIQDDKIYQSFKNSFKIKQRGSGLVIDITATAKTPEMAALMANSYAEEFINLKTDLRIAIAADANQKLAAESIKLKAKLENDEQALHRFKEENQAISLQSDQNVTVQKLTAMNAAVTAALSSRVALEADLEQIRKVGPTNTAELLKIPSVATLPEILLAKQQLSGARSELSSMEGHYLDKNPKHIDAVNKVKGLESNLASVASRAGTQVEQQYESAKQTEAKMESQLKAQEDATMKLNALAIPYNTLLQQVATDQALYEAVIGRRNETGVATGVASVPFHIIERAMVPAKASHPNYVKTLALGFFGLSLLAIILIVITDESRGSIRSVSEAESSLKLPVLAAIPDNRINFFKRFRLRFLAVFTIFKGHAKPSPADKTANTPKNVPYSDVKSKYPIIMLDDPGSHIAESYRAMRASIALLPKDQSQLLLFTSCAPDEGKTFSSLNYSVSLAQAGFKTLIVDTDLRRPSLHEALLGGEIRPGLSDYLSGKNTLEQVILPTRVEHLFLITAGTFLKNPAELIERADLVDLAEKLKEHHERVVLDSAPVNAVSYTLLIASALKQVILVVRAELTPSVVIKRSLEILKCKSGANILGIVLNRLTPGASAYHFYHYYGDKYVKNSVYGTGRTIW